MVSSTSESSLIAIVTVIFDADVELVDAVELEAIVESDYDNTVASNSARVIAILNIFK